MKAIILNQCTVEDSFLEVTDACLDTWASSSEYDDIKILNYFGAYDLNDEPISKFKHIPPKGSSVEYSENSVDYLILGCSDLIDYQKGYDPRGLKQLMAFDYVYSNYDFDILYRTGCTSYIVLNKLVDCFNRIPLSNIYEGSATMSWADYDDKPNTDFKYVIGANMFISKDIVKIVLDNRDIYIKETSAGLGIPHYEDVILGKLLTYDLKLGDGVSDFNQPLSYLSVCRYSKEDSGFDINIDCDFFNYRLDKNLASEFLRLHRAYGKI